MSKNIYETRRNLELLCVILAGKSSLTRSEIRKASNLDLRTFDKAFRYGTYYGVIKKISDKSRNSRYQYSAAEMRLIIRRKQKREGYSFSDLLSAWDGRMLD